MLCGVLATQTATRPKFLGPWRDLHSFHKLWNHVRILDLDLVKWGRFVGQLFRASWNLEQCQNQLLQASGSHQEMLCGDVMDMECHLYQGYECYKGKLWAFKTKCCNLYEVGPPYGPKMPALLLALYFISFLISWDHLETYPWRWKGCRKIYFWG